MEILSGMRCKIRVKDRYSYDNEKGFEKKIR